MNVHSTALSPNFEGRLNVVSGDVSWGVETMSYSKHETGNFGDVTVAEYAQLTGSISFRPSVTTVIRLEAITESITNQEGEIQSASLSIAGETYAPIT